MRYLELYNSGELLDRVRTAYRRLAACDLCPHDCGVDRIRDRRGICGAGLKPRIASANVHRGEEPAISGTRGSGTVFLSGCSLQCEFCQNFPISQLRNGEDLTTAALADRLLQLQRRKVHNINFVTPTHFLPQILAALWSAIPRGFRLPLVWNSSGYEKVDCLELLDGIVSVYLPDMKYADAGHAAGYSQAPGYQQYNRPAVREMLRQVGHLVCDDDGLALHGLVIRHLVLPGDVSGSGSVLRWIAENLGTETYISLMNQYFPAHRAVDSKVINRKVSSEEYEAAVQALFDAGLDNGWVQD